MYKMSKNNLIFPSFSRVAEMEAKVRASLGNPAVDKAFRDAGLSGDEQPAKVRTFVRKWSALQAICPSIAYPAETRNALDAIAGLTTPAGLRAAPATASPAAKLAQSLSSARPVAPASKPADASSSPPGIERMMAGMRREMAAGTFGLPPQNNKAGAWSLSPNLTSIPPVGKKIARLDVDQLGALCCEVLGEIETNRLVARSNSDAETVHLLERQMFIENLVIPGQTENSFDQNLRMTKPTGLYAGAHRKQQEQIKAFVAYLESQP